MEDNEILDVNFGDEGLKKRIELVGANQFILLYFLSLGIYGLWWMYKTWKFFKEKDRLDIIPAGRAIFAIFFTYALFEKILAYAKYNGYPKSYSSGGLFVMFVLLNFLARLPDPYGIAISILAFLCFLEPIQALNYAIANDEEFEGIQQSSFNSRQIIIIIVGIMFWILILIGLFIPG